MERVTRPIAVAEKFALISMSAAALAGILWKRNLFLGWLLGVISLPHSDAVQAGTSLIDGWITVLMAAGLGTVALCAGLTVYLLREKE
jgi:hypothetical protein